jgi:hypothetical protein
MYHPADQGRLYLYQIYENNIVARIQGEKITKCYTEQVVSMKHIFGSATKSQKKQKEYVEV